MATAPHNTTAHVTVRQQSHISKCQLKTRQTASGGDGHITTASCAQRMCHKAIRRVQLPSPMSTVWTGKI